MAKHGTHMGWTLPYRHPSTDLSFDIARAAAAGTKWIRWGTEITDSMTSDPNSTSATVTLNLTPLAAQIAQVHAAGMRVMLAVLGVPRKVNASAGSSDPSSGGTYHWFATTSGGRTIVANYTAAVAAILDPALDILQCGNELSNGAFNHDGNASHAQPGFFGSSAAVVATQMAEQILAVRAAVPTLKIAAGSLITYGDIYNGTDTATGIPAPNWVGAMLASTTTLSNGAQTGTALKTGAARPDYWTISGYTGSAPPASGWVMHPTGPELTSGYGYGMPQFILMRAVLGINGAQAPDGTQCKFAIAEYGTSRTALEGTLQMTESIQANYVGQYVFVYEQFKNDGWLTGPTFYYTLTGDDKALFRSTSPYAPYQGGTQMTSWANADEATVVPPPTIPVARFTMSRASGPSPLAVTFTDTSTNTPTSWAWDFTNNGSTDSTSQNPSHTFTGNGTYTVKLTATNTGGSSTVTHTVTVADAPPPSAGGGLDYLVELGIPPTILSDLTSFVLDDSSRGHLDQDTLADDYSWFPVTGDVQSIDVTRGRNRDLDRTEAGTCSIVLRNDRVDHGTAGDYDPFNWSSPFFPWLGPRAVVRASLDGAYLFGGDVSDMPIDDIQDNVVTTTINAVDWLARLNKPIKYTPEYDRSSGDGTHTAGKRIARILERAGWEGETFLFTGVNTYQTGFPQEGTALDMIQDIAASEGGMAYCSMGPLFSHQFIDRFHMAGSPPLFTLSDDPTEPLRYSGLVRNIGLDLMYNTITIHPLNEKTGKDGEIVHGDRAPVSAHDDLTASIYGERSYEVTWPIATELGRTFRANQLLADYKNPALRVETVTIPAAKYSASDRRAYITGQELGHILTVERTPPGGGVYSLFGGPITKNSVIIGIQHHCEPRMVTTTFTLTNQFAP